MSADIVKLFPSNMAAHPPPRSFREVVRDQLRAHRLTVESAELAFRRCLCFSEEAAQAEVARILDEIRASHGSAP